LVCFFSPRLHMQVDNLLTTLLADNSYFSAANATVARRRDQAVDCETSDAS
jgi:hypothetical protein